MYHRLHRLPLLLLPLLLVMLLAACGGKSGISDDATLPAGDVRRGTDFYTVSINGAPSCLSCHSLDGQRLDGPTLQGYGAVAGSRIAGMSAEDYTRQSILQPAAHLVSGFSNIMYNQYRQRLSTQQLADLIAYLLTL